VKKFLNVGDLDWAFFLLLFFSMFMHKAGDEGCDLSWREHLCFKTDRKRMNALFDRGA
jgi:hypothetical protein